MICGSCGMRMDGAAVLACKTRMVDIAQSGHVPVISAMGNMPIVKDLVVDMEPFWGKIRAVEPWLEPGYSIPARRSTSSRRSRWTRSTRSRSASCAAAASPSATRWRRTRTSSARPRWRRACASSATRATGDRRAPAVVLREHGIWDCTRCYFCQERCPKGVDPRDAIAKLGAEAMGGIDSDMGAKHAKWFVTSAKTTGWLRETEARAEDAGRREVAQGGQVRDEARQARQGAAAVPATSRSTSTRRALSTTSSSSRTRGRRRHRPVREGALAPRVRHGRRRARPYGEGSFPKPAGPGTPRMRTVAYYKGCLASLSAKELDTSTQALAPKSASS